MRRKKRVSARTLGPIEEWIVRFHIGWREEWSIKSVKYLPSRHVLKLWGWRWYVTVQNEQYLLAVGLSCYKSYWHQQLYKIKLINTNYEFIYLFWYLITRRKHTFKCLKWKSGLIIFLCLTHLGPSWLVSPSKSNLVRGLIVGFWISCIKQSAALSWSGSIWSNPHERILVFNINKHPKIFAKTTASKWW